VRLLPLFHDVAGRPVVVAGEGEAAEAKRRLVREAGGEPVDDHPDARLAFVAGDAPEAAAAALKARGLLVNVADRPDLCDFLVPAVVDRAPVTIAVSSAGASAGLAKAVKERLEAWLPAGLGRLAAALRDARPAMAAALPEGRARRAWLGRALASGGALDVLREHPNPDAAVLAALEGAAESDAGTVEIALPADPDELTLRELRLLAAADAVVGDVPLAFAPHVRRDAARLSALPDPAPPGLTILLS
jgi:uroporphyrin-III C-methyltransferase/precorrin-2 dehydrogenase/sirohydrochlorin ferrochelatase